jgi:hypothetical protein
MNKKTEKEEERLEPRDFGINEPSMDPLKTIQMEGEFFRGIAKPEAKRPLLWRILGIFLGIFFIIFSLIMFIFLFKAGFSKNSFDSLANIFRSGFPLLLFLVGIKLIWANIRK